jgi:hypothetical protein
MSNISTYGLSDRTPRIIQFMNTNDLARIILGETDWHGSGPFEPPRRKADPLQLANLSRKLRRWALAGHVPGAVLRKGKHPRFPKTRQLRRWIDNPQYRISKRVAAKSHALGLGQIRPAKPKRTVAHVASNVAPIQVFFNKFTAFRQILEKITTNTAMADWPQWELDKFLTETQWLDDERTKARAVLESYAD